MWPWWHEIERITTPAGIESSSLPLLLPVRPIRHLCPGRLLAAGGLPQLWIPSADSFRRVQSIPVLGTGKLDLKRVKEVALEEFKAVPSPSGKG